MADGQTTTRRRRDDPSRPHAATTTAVADRYQYDIAKDLPPCPDAAPEGNWELSGRLWEGQFRQGRLVGQRTRVYPTKGALNAQVRALREVEPRLVSMNFGAMRKGRLRESEPTDWWSYGINTPSPFGGGLTTPYIPLLPGPATRQLYWADYFAMSAKAFEAYQHNPLAHRAVEIGTEFVIGRGVQAVAKTDRGQACWDAYWERNNMDARLEDILGDLTTYGELFLRYFKTPLAKGLVVRSLDPAGIYEIVTDQEDWESVYFYHQQEQERAQLFAPPGGNIAPTGPTTEGAVTRYTIRQIPAEEIDHYRINARSGEVRGRSDLFPALGYLKRLQDLLTAKVIRTDMEARMVFDLVTKGNAQDVTNTRNAIFPGGKPPEPGAVIAHNEHAELKAFQFSGASEHSDSSVEELVTMCALGTGVSRQWLWESVHSGGARAGALVATEPGQKRFERRQRMTQRILADMAKREFEANGLRGEDAEIEFIFPSIAVEERSAALKDIAFAESMGWISKKKAADMAARQLDIETFSFGDEQEAIAEEFEKAEEDEGDGNEGKPPKYDAAGNVTDPGEPAKAPTPKQGDGVIRRPMVNATFRQSPKLDPTKAATSEDQPPGLLIEGGGVAPPASPGATAPGRMGIPGDESPMTQAGKANIRKDSGSGSSLRESDPDPFVRLAIAGMREAALAGARVPRRKPDDPEFIAESEAYKRESRRNLRDLIRGVRHGTNGNANQEDTNGTAEG